MPDKSTKPEISTPSPQKSQRKEEFEKIKKTVNAYGEISETAALEKARNVKKVSEELVEKELEKEKEKEIIAPIEETRMQRRERLQKEEERNTLLGWAPKTKLGQDVKDGKIKNIDDILDRKGKILEPEIVDTLLSVQNDLISIGQSKGKFGGGKRRAWRQTQRKTKEGNVPTFSTMAVIGDGNGHVGVGSGKSKETLPARDKAVRKAKLNIMKVARTCAGFDCACDEKHTIPFKVYGKAGSVRVELIPAPQGTGLVVANELKKILKLAGIKDIYSRTTGTKKTTFNLVKACIDALEETTK